MTKKTNTAKIEEIGNNIKKLIPSMVAVVVATEILNLIKIEAGLTWQQKLWRKIKRKARILFYGRKKRI